MWFIMNPKRVKNWTKVVMTIVLSGTLPFPSLFTDFLHLPKTFPHRNPKSQNLTRISVVEYFVEDKTEEKTQLDEQAYFLNLQA